MSTWAFGIQALHLKGNAYRKLGYGDFAETQFAQASDIYKAAGYKIDHKDRIELLRDRAKVSAKKELVIATPPMQRCGLAVKKARVLWY